MTSPERYLRTWMMISALLYAGGGFMFLFFPRILLHVLDSFAHPLHLATVLPGALAAERFWNILAFAMAVTITTASLMVVRDPVGNKEFCIPVLFSKAASWLSALVYFAMVSRAFAHLVIFLVDFPLFVLTVMFYARARRQAGTS
jgi:hypothetical protein